MRKGSSHTHSKAAYEIPHKKSDRIFGKLCRYTSTVKPIREDDRPKDIIPPLPAKRLLDLNKPSFGQVWSGDFARDFLPRASALTALVHERRFSTAI